MRWTMMQALTKDGHKEWTAFEFFVQDSLAFCEELGCGVLVLYVIPGRRRNRPRLVHDSLLVGRQAIRGRNEILQFIAKLQLRRPPSP